MSIIGGFVTFFLVGWFGISSTSRTGTVPMEYTLTSNSTVESPQNTEGNSKPESMDEFVSCLKAKKAIFYGAFWCPHCRDQKAIFGSSADLLPYVECSTPDGEDQTQICRDTKITSYPTWIFADGSIEKGPHTLEELSQKTGCELPSA